MHLSNPRKNTPCCFNKEKKVFGAQRELFQCDLIRKAVSEFVICVNLQDLGTEKRLEDSGYPRLWIATSWQ